MTNMFKVAGGGVLLAAFISFGAFVAAPRAYAQGPIYIEWENSPRYYPGDEDSRVARAHFVNGQYGLAAEYYRRSVEATPQNGAAWIGLAASYDEIGRYDLARHAYRVARRLAGNNPLLLNNLGYERLLRGDRRAALRLFHKARRLDPYDPTIANNLALAEEGQYYFWNGPDWPTRY